MTDFHLFGVHRNLLPRWVLAFYPQCQDFYAAFKLVSFPMFKWMFFKRAAMDHVNELFHVYTRVQVRCIPQQSETRLPAFFSFVCSPRFGAMQMKILSTTFDGRLGILSYATSLFPYKQGFAYRTVGGAAVIIRAIATVIDCSPCFISDKGNVFS